MKTTEKSFKLYKSIYQLEELTSTEKILYSYFQFTTSSKFNTTLSIRRLSKKLNLNTYSVRVGINKLISTGKIKREGNIIVAVAPDFVNQKEYISIDYSILQLKVPYASKFILSYVLFFTNYDKSFYVSNANIAKELALDLDTIDINLKLLDDKNLIKRIQVSETYSNFSYKREIQVNRDVLSNLINKKVLDLQPAKIVIKKAPTVVKEVIKPIEVMKEIKPIEVMEIETTFNTEELIKFAFGPDTKQVYVYFKNNFKYRVQPEIKKSELIKILSENLSTVKSILSYPFAYEREYVEAINNINNYVPTDNVEITEEVIEVEPVLKKETKVVILNNYQIQLEENQKWFEELISNE